MSQYFRICLCFVPHYRHCYISLCGTLCEAHGFGAFPVPIISSICVTSVVVSRTCSVERRLAPFQHYRHLIIRRISFECGPCRSSAVRRLLPTAAARVRVRAACGVCGAQSGTGTGLLRVLRFPLPIIPPISPLS
jgi:hypothetical protein